MNFILSFPLLDKLLLGIINGLGIWLALWVYFANSHKRANRLFSLLTAFLLFWITGGYLFNVLGNSSIALILGRLILGEVFVSLVIFYVFLIYFPQKNEASKFLEKGTILLGIVVFLLTSFTDLIVRNVELTSWGANPVFNPYGKYIFYGLVVFLSILIFREIFVKYFVLSRKERLKIQYLLVGLCVFILFNLVFNVFLPLVRGTVQYWQFGNYSAIFLLGFTAFAIVKRQLFEIKVVLTQLLVGVIAILLLVNIVGSESVFEYIWKGSLFVAFLVTGALLIKSVLNEIKRREQLEKVTAQLRVANVELKKLDQAKTEFLAVASHQLRTPLTAIRGYLSMLRRGDYGQVPIDFADPLREVYQSTLRLAKLTNRLLDVTRIETGRLRISLGPVSLGGLISSVVDELKPQAKEKSLYLKFLKPKEKLSPLPLDLEKIRQVFLNIIDNGLKYTQKGGIEISLGLVGVDRVQVKIQDTGEGMTKKELKKIFQSFSRGLAGEKFHTAGAGLGLYIAKEFVELHQGKIWATSSGTGKGTTVWIELPLKSNQVKTEKDPTSFPGKKKKKLS